MSYQGIYTGNGTTPPEPTWNGPASWTYPHNLLRLSIFNLVNVSWWQQFERMIQTDRGPGLRVTKTAAFASSPYFSRNYSPPSTLVQLNAGDELASSIAVYSTQGGLTHITNNRRNSATTGGFESSVLGANIWGTIREETMTGSVDPPTNVFYIVFVSGGSGIQIGTSVTYAQPRILRRPAGQTWLINDIPYRPHPQDWYQHGMWWQCQSSGVINGHAFSAGDRLYATGDINAPYLLAGDVKWSNTPLFVYLGSIPVISAYAGTTQIQKVVGSV